MEEKATLLNLRYSMLTLKLLWRRLVVFHWVGNLSGIPGLPESGKGPCRHFLKSILIPFPFPLLESIYLPHSSLGTPFTFCFSSNLV